ncbi:DUF2515 domain-containing protein [Saccharococcus caldoxylosilyticus]|uniref:DUF2515 domain-containing protein n=1 Tax=Saccharococcus caldoxylosilyticus TaxID=81408 RepID=UPI000306B219|nr:DUF2515 domain-containing protein [Parageobacillus caldoxylosilyticus]OQO99077.1 hypothetical protein BSK33_15815 [Geobacillus sp. 44B]QNU36889.1 DUF2515 domain-containing protein [Geobacillus sp. 44B]QXJ40123.1 hypothetical protein BV455_03496 [Parageobacillus caldoxylosilyticus]
MFWTKKKTPTLSPFLLEIKNELKKKRKGISNIVKEANLTMEEKRLVEQIAARTKEKNENNVTRTAAYLDFYKRHPEIHWAFLGHMVSRNGGWNMTDLKGELLLHLLTEEERQSFFSFLERGNWLIFQDIYPQFLLYEESKKRRKPLFYLLPMFHVSTFMETIWNHFWRRGDPYILAIALVINEQSYLEKRVIQNPVFQKSVFHTIEFKLQDFLSLNHILFPYEDQQGNPVLIGQTLHQFHSLHERILLGKRLYSLLFQNNGTLERVVRWASLHPHTGTRKDYWPHLFNDVCELAPRQPYRRRIKDCQIQPGVPRIYSPRLLYAWKNVAHEEAEPGDWFDDWNVVEYLVKSTEQINGEITHAYCETLEKMELAIIAKNAFFPSH